jgi:hypothetical protein
MPLNLPTAKPVQHTYQFDSREHKLRIVERLGTVGNALQSEVTMGQHQQYKGQVTGARPGSGSDQHRAHTGSQTTASGTEKVCRDVCPQSFRLHSCHLSSLNKCPML